MQKLESIKQKLIELQEKLDAYEMKSDEQSTQSYESLHQDAMSLDQDIKNISSRPESTAISYRLLLQEQKSQLKQLILRIKGLQPKLEIPQNQPLSMDALYDAYLKAQRFHLKKDAYTLDKEQFLNAVKAARFKARNYYDGQKTSISIEVDEKGPYIIIERRKLSA